MKQPRLRTSASTLIAATVGLLATAAGAEQLKLSLSPPAIVKEPPPNVLLTIDDSRSLGPAGLTALKDALKATFAASSVPDGAIRLAWHSLNRCRDLPMGTTPVAACGAYNGMRSLDAVHRSNFLSWVDTELYYAATGPSNTASHLATQRVADYFKSRGDYNPWRNDPTNPDNKDELSCRKSFHVFMTDGAWNYSGSNEIDGNGINMEGNADGTNKRLPDGTKYDVANTSLETRIYRDPWGSSKLSTFADLAFHLWSTDLRPDLPDNVRFRQNVTVSETLGKIGVTPYWNPKNNPANWQHLVTYTIGFTAAATQWTGDPVWTGDMYSGAGIDGLTRGTTTWESPLCGASKNDPCAFDVAASHRAQELWHAALNGRGRYIPSETSDDLVNAFKLILQTIQSESLGGVVSIAANTRRLVKDGLVYLASFKTEPWSGDLTSLDVTAATVDVERTPNWSAATQLNSVSVSNRVVLTSNGTQAVDFLWNNLTTAQKNDLKGTGGTDTQGQDRLNYLRGDRSREASQAGGTLRTRSSLLGTIVNSNLWVNSISPLYPVEHPGHAEFRKWVRDPGGLGTPRTTVVYVGSGDGMVHGFNGSTGVERLAYVPLGVYPRLAAYTSPSYVHQYMVDGSPFTGDVDISQSGTGNGATPLWRTLLVAPLGAGGRGFAVLDVTSTASADLRQASTLVADRSFSASATTAGYTGFEDVGQITTNPTTDVANPIRADQFVRLNNGRWAVLMGNGINSINERPVLLIQYVDGPRELAYLVTQPTKGITNGLGAPRPLDVDGNGTTDVVYAGDFQGHLWKFDLTSTDPLKWGVAAWNSSGVCFGAVSACQPMVRVTSTNTRNQAILVAPTWLIHPLGGVVLQFGTGKLLEEADRKNIQVQTLYGIWDSSQYTRTAQGVTALHGPNITDSNPRNRLVGQSFTDNVARTADTADPRTFVNSSRNPVGYSRTDPTAPRGWYLDLPAAGERLLSHPQLRSGRLVRFETVVPPRTPEEGLCSASLAAEQGFVNVINGLTGQPSLQGVFISPDATLDLSQASRVNFGTGESLTLETGDITNMLYIPASSTGASGGAVGGSTGGGSTGGGSTISPRDEYLNSLQLKRQASVPKTVDWRVLQ